MPDRRADLLRAVAYGYAMMTALVGIGLLAFLVVIYAAFGLKPADWLLVALFVIPAIVCFALAPYIWRQNAWAMIAALGADRRGARHDRHRRFADWLGDDHRCDSVRDFHRLAALVGCRPCRWQLSPRMPSCTVSR